MRRRGALPPAAQISETEKGTSSSTGVSLPHLITSGRQDNVPDDLHPPCRRVSPTGGEDSWNAAAGTETLQGFAYQAHLELSAP
jgi:hypothetical protein